MGTQEFIERVNAARRLAKGGWYEWQGEVNGKVIRIKGYQTWLQIAESNGTRFSFPMDISVARFKQCLMELVD